MILNKFLLPINCIIYEYNIIIKYVDDNDNNNNNKTKRLYDHDENDVDNNDKLILYYKNQRIEYIYTILTHI